LRVDEEAKLLAAGGAVVRQIWAQLESEGFFK
jgi:hypothetical protein